ncbi:MAG TPA: MFS transporter [Baekduia sp.]|uniref:MFS transporter n=1 Tax=Baekduia sp. TaxID=2600305 RepID=UPI002C5B2BFE|nr:MFS transporter [Baekduia sp.]HMJ33695.1 MFS transporter [Baekduia sp.]
MSTSVAFAVHGAVAGSFATRIPWIRDRLGLSAGALGLALLVPALGALLAMPATGALVHRFPGRTITRILVGAFCLALALPALAPSLGWLCLALLVFGALGGMADIAMNTQGVLVEECVGRSIMSGLHGAWSIGGIAGGAIGALAAHAGLDARVHLGAMAVALLAVALVACRGLLEAPPAPAGAGHEPLALAWPSRPVLLIGAVGFGAVFAEGASADWCAVYLRDVMGSAPGTAAVAYTGFAAAMAAGRLRGDAVVRRIGAVRAVRIGGLLASAGALLVVAARTPVLGIAGFALIGLGIAVVVPLAFAAGGRAVPHAGQGIAAVATVSYGAGLAAPGAIGGIAAVVSLPGAFVVVAALTALVSAGAAALRPAAVGEG